MADQVGLDLFAIGEPEQVVEKNLAQQEVFGTEVAPIVRREMASRTGLS